MKHNQMTINVVHLRYGSDDLPVLPRHAWSSNSNFGLLGTAFSVHIGATFFSVCSSRKYDISHGCSNISMVTWKIMAHSLKTGRNCKTKTRCVQFVVWHKLCNAVSAIIEKTDRLDKS